MQLVTARVHPLTLQTIDALKVERARLRGEHERRRLARTDPTLRDTIARMETRKRARMEPEQSPEDGERERGCLKMKNQAATRMGMPSTTS
eukprot:1078381-Prorocentrum_minimum.AAC.2